MEDKDSNTDLKLMELTEDILRSAYENMLDDISCFYNELYKAFIVMKEELTEHLPDNCFEQSAII
jgi:hypothetical protein